MQYSDRDILKGGMAVYQKLVIFDDCEPIFQKRLHVLRYANR